MAKKQTCTIMEVRDFARMIDPSIPEHELPPAGGNQVVVERNGRFKLFDVIERQANGDLIVTAAIRQAPARLDS